MSKSRYSKTKAAGEAIGVSRYGKQFNHASVATLPKNRQIRRMESRGK